MSRLGRSSTALAASSAALQRVGVVGDLAEVLDVPAVGLEALADVVGERELGRAVDGDVVVVVDADQPSEAEVPGERRRLVADALHQAAVAGDHAGVVVDQLAAEAVAQHPLGDGHADGVGEALPERAGRDLDADGVAGLGVPGCAAPERPEGPEVVELEAVAAEVEHRVLQDRGVTVGEDEAVAVGPVRGRRGRVASPGCTARGRAARAPSPCPGGRSWRAAGRPSRSHGSSRSPASGCRGAASSGAWQSSPSTLTVPADRPRRVRPVGAG